MLDVGCGNGRFAAFLAEQGPSARITGFDSSAYLLRKAAESVPAGAWFQADALAPWPLATRFDLVVMFGVLHHVPGFAQRQQIITRALDHLPHGGLLMVTLWRFYDQARFRQRIVPWDSPEVPAEYQGLDLEAGDYLLRWGRADETLALRYCHHVNGDECARLFGETVAQFEADTANTYIILQKG